MKICGEYALFTPQIWEYLNGRICLKIINKNVAYLIVIWQYKCHNGTGYDDKQDEDFG